MNVRVSPAAALVVGGGFIGSHVARTLVQQDVRTTVLTRTAPSARTRARMSGSRVMVGDASDPGPVEQAAEGVNSVIWCAGGLLPAESNQHPMQDLVAQLAPLLAVLERLKSRKDVRVAMVSSGGTVYGNPRQLPVPESYVPRPLTSHGVTRLAAEHYLDLYQQVHGLSTVAFRCSNVYGEGQRADRSQGVVAAALERVRRGVPVPLFGDGSTVRDFLHIDDAVDVMIRLLARPDLPNVINVGSGVGTSLRGLLELIGSITGMPVRIEPHPARPGDVKAVVLDVSLLRSLVPFEPTDLRDGLARCWDAADDGERIP